MMMNGIDMKPLGRASAPCNPVPAHREPVDAVGAEGQSGHVEGLVAGEDGIRDFRYARYAVEDAELTVLD